MESRRVSFVAQFMPSLWFGHKTRYCNWSNVDMKDYMRRNNSSQKRKVLANVDMEDTLFQDVSMGFYCQFLGRSLTVSHVFLPYFFVSFFQIKLRQGNIFSENPMLNLAKVFLWMSLKSKKRPQEKRHIWIHHLRLPRRFGMNQPRPAALWVQALAPGWPACQFGLSGFKPARFAALRGIFLGTWLSWQVNEYPKWPKTNSCLVVIFGCLY